VAKAITHHKAIAHLTKPTVQIKYSTEQNVDSNDNQIGSCEISVFLTMSSKIQHSDPHPIQGLDSLRMLHVGQALSSYVKLLVNVNINTATQSFANQTKLCDLSL
jgi:hypothetical protein